MHDIAAIHLPMHLFLIPSSHHIGSIHFSGDSALVGNLIGCAVDSDDNVVAAGFIRASTSDSSATTTSSTTADHFVVKLDTSGTQVCRPNTQLENIEWTGDLIADI